MFNDGVAFLSRVLHSLSFSVRSQMLVLSLHVGKQIQVSNDFGAAQVYI